MFILQFFLQNQRAIFPQTWYKSTSGKDNKNVSKLRARFSSKREIITKMLISGEAIEICFLLDIYITAYCHGVDSNLYKRSPGVGRVDKRGNKFVHEYIGNNLCSLEPNLRFK
jgi:hypothetical protein